MDEFIFTYGQDILLAILTALAGYLGAKIKKLYEKYINDNIKKSVVKTCVQAAEQLFKDADGEKKYAQARSNIIAILNEKGLSIGEQELQMMIESVVSSFHNQLGGNHE